MSDPVTILVWRDAKTDPPDGALLVQTDRGLAYRVLAQWFSEDDDSDLMPAPTVWAELPVPPPSDPLTLDDLRVLLACVSSWGDDPAYGVKEQAVARLRDILEGAE